MLVGGNSRTVAAAVDAKISEINRTLPPSVRIRTILNRTQLVDATVRTVATNLLEGAALVILVLLLLLGNFRAAFVSPPWSSPSPCSSPRWACCSSSSA
jgi:heavy metal efflux system protein